MYWIVQKIRKRIGETVIYGESGYMKRNGLDVLDGLDGLDCPKGETVIYVVSGYMKRNVLDCPKYKEEDWTNSDLRGVGIYEEEWTGRTVWTGLSEI